MKVEISLNFNNQHLYCELNQGIIFDDKLKIIFSISTMFSFFRFCIIYNDVRLIEIVTQSDFDYDQHWNWIKQVYCPASSIENFYFEDYEEEKQ